MEPSHICKFCDTLMAGPLASDRVRWVICSDCERQRAERRKEDTGHVGMEWRFGGWLAVRYADRRTTGRREDDG